MLRITAVDDSLIINSFKEYYCCGFREVDVIQAYRAEENVEEVSLSNRPSFSFDSSHRKFMYSSKKAQSFSVLFLQISANEKSNAENER